MMKKPDKQTQKRLERARDRMIAAAREELAKGDISAPDMLAIVAYMTGALIAYQDQHKITPETAMALVLENIQNGNTAAMNARVGTKH